MYDLYLYYVQLVHTTNMSIQLTLTTTSVCHIIHLTRVLGYYIYILLACHCLELFGTDTVIISIYTSYRYCMKLYAILSVSTTLKILA